MAYNDKWKKTFPASVGNAVRPDEPVENNLAYESDGFPQFITEDPVHADKQNAFLKQLFSNDERLKESIATNKKAAFDDLTNHNKNATAHATGIAGNAATATKLKTAHTINVQDASASNTGTGASFNGSGNATIKLPAKIKATLNGNADTATKTTATSTEDKSVLELVKGTTNNDWGAIRAGSTAKDAGYLEISTGDGGTEPIYARQISTASGKEVVTHEAALLDASGNTKFPGTVTAASFDGNASSATKLATARTISLTGDASGSVSFNGTANAAINTTVAKATQLKTSRTINVTDADGTNTGTGASFNGTANATVKLPATIKANLTGNAASATKLETARTINVTDADGTNTGTGASFNGTNNATIKLPANIRLFGLKFPNVDGEIRPTGGDGQKNFAILAHTNDFNYSSISLSSKINGNGSGYIYIVSRNGEDSSQLLLTPTGASYDKTLKTTIDGNASSATKLETARTINGVSFDGTKNITISDDAIESKSVSNPNAWWVKLKGGLIIQGGIVSDLNSGIRRIEFTFPVAFNSFGVNFAIDGGDGIFPMSTQLVSLTKGYVYVGKSSNTGKSPYHVSFTYLAIGM